MATKLIMIILKIGYNDNDFLKKNSNALRK